MSSQTLIYIFVSYKDIDIKQIREANRCVVPKDDLFFRALQQEGP